MTLDCAPRQAVAMEERQMRINADVMQAARAVAARIRRDAEPLAPYQWCSGKVDKSERLAAAILAARTPGELGRAVAAANRYRRRLRPGRYQW